MKPKLTLLCVSVAAALFPASAQAQMSNFITQDAGWYWGADLGATIPQDGRLTRFGNLSVNDSISYGVGGGVDVSAGYAFNRYFSLEAQVGWTWNPINSVQGSSVHDTSLSTMPLMANAVLQWPIPQTRIIPYVGAGAGGALTLFDTGGFTSSAPGGPVTLYGNDTDFVFAWQAFAGVRLELNDKISVGIGYRYLSVDSSSYNFESYYYRGPTMSLDFSKLQSHMAALTFTMKF
jgi:opacity protein-like surface antigen